jgi:hypothetical protein
MKNPLTLLVLALSILNTTSFSVDNNLERIRSIAIPFESGESLPRSFKDFLKTRKMVVVGEMHGTKEAPDFLGQMIKAVANRKTKILVALEVPTFSQRAVDKFLLTANEDYLRQDRFFASRYQDGRSSEAIVRLLQEVSRLPGVTVYCMDPGGQNARLRDVSMARNIVFKARGFDRVFVLTGNIHSSRVLGTEWDSRYRPMAYELLKIKPSYTLQLLNILIRFEEGSSWNCMGVSESSCGTQVWPSQKSDYSEALPFEKYFVPEGRIVHGHNGSLFIRRIHESRPFVHGR